MLVTESKLRKIIRQVILENSSLPPNDLAEECHECLRVLSKIDKKLLEQLLDDYYECSGIRSECEGTALFSKCFEICTLFNKSCSTSDAFKVSEWVFSQLDD